MNKLRRQFAVALIFFCPYLNAQSHTQIDIQLDVDNKGRIAVKVFPPIEKNNWRYVIPTIIPGTYMKINYKRFYQKIVAIDENGEKMKVRKKDNVLMISGEVALSHLSYTVEQSYGDGKIWDNILACAGTIFTDDSYLLNFQLVSGYFEGYQDQPFRIKLEKDKKLYGATSLKNERVDSLADIFITDNYSALIDQPILYTKADTTSFKIKDQKFHVAIHSETGKTKAEMIKPRLHKIMHAIDSFSGFTTKEDYHFFFYYIDRERLKGPFKYFGVGSALEHNNSSVYFYSDPPFDTTFINLDWIAAHEYFHTITPLGLHSEKIHNFNFETPDMSRHGWLYEGVTDYFAALLSAQYDLTNSLRNNMRWAVRTAEKQKPRSFTESSRNIIKKNMFSWIGKIGQLSNFYERGKLIAFAMDVELYEQSNGEKRLIDVMLKMYNDLDGSYFEDDQFVDLLVKSTYPEMRDFYNKYIEGDEIIPYDNYFEKLGWIYYPKGTKVPGYGRIWLRYHRDKKHYYINHNKKNSFKLKKGDIIKVVNGIEATQKNAQEINFWNDIFFPKEQSRSEMIVLRNGEEQVLSAQAKPQKLKFLRIAIQEEFTSEQQSFRKGFYKQ